VEAKGGTTSKVVSSNTAPEGGGVAKGVGVTVNVHSKETVLSLQTTIKEKETLIQQVTTRLKATASELDQAKVFWKAAQAETSELQRQIRNEKSCRRDESNANKLASDKLGASLAREEARSGKLAEGLKEAEAAVRVLRSERDALQRSLDEARQSWSLERDAAKSAAAKAEALDAQVAAERQCRGKAENELASAKAKIEDDARLWASERETLRRALDEREERWRGERDAMQSKISVAMGEAESVQRRMEMEREEHRSKMIDLEGRVEKERRESGAREDERVRELVSKRQREMDGKERQFKSSASKLLSSELAFESSITCMACLSIMSNPVTCTPCGHSTCSSCYHAAGNTCAECGLVGGSAIPNNALDAVCGKFSLRVQELAGLQQMLRGF
jgi:chromosome segregation ATPase